MTGITKKYAGLLSLYLLFACWAPVFWFIDSTMERHSLSQFGLSELSVFELILGLVVILGSFFAQFLLFFIKIDNEQN